VKHQILKPESGCVQSKGRELTIMWPILKSDDVRVFVEFDQCLNGDRSKPEGHLQKGAANCSDIIHKAPFGQGDNALKAR
jgi:hypothetical protein